MVTMKSKRNKQTTANELIREQILRIEKKNVRADVSNVQKTHKILSIFCLFLSIRERQQGKAGSWCRSRQGWSVFYPLWTSMCSKGLIAQHTPFSIRWYEFRVLFRVSFCLERSLGPSSAVGKGKKRGEIGKILAREASRAVVWGGEMGGVPFPSPEYRSARFARRFFPPFSPNAEPGPRLLLTKRAARRWTDSIQSIPLIVCGDQATVAYSTIGRTKDRYARALTGRSHDERFLSEGSSKLS